MALLDERRCHVEVNGAYVSLLGYPKRELLGHPIYEFIVGGPQVTAQEWLDAMDAGSFSRQSEMRCFGRPHGDRAVGGHDRARDRTAVGAVRGAQHLALGRAPAPAAQRPAERASPDRAASSRSSA